MHNTLLEFQVFQIGFSNQKVPQNDRGLENHFGFLGQVDLNNSSTTMMVF
jgi:hypothetical protein